MLLKLETHLHTLHSDGQDTVADMFAACRAAGYDAVALTDHNTLSGFAEARVVAADLGLILIPGVEVTTFRGHSVVLGVSRVPEWRDLDIRGFSALARDVHTEGGVVCISHPAQLGSPICSGCAWEWPIDPELVDLWEIFSGAHRAFPHPDVSHALWRQHLERGGHAAPVAAGDVHSSAAARAARAATYVDVTKRNADGVLEALRRGRTFASWNGEAGTAVERVATAGGEWRYAVRRGESGELKAVSAATWIATSQVGVTSV